MNPEEALANAFIFADLHASDLKRLAKLMSPTQFAAGSVVIKEGDQADSLFVVSSGKLAADHSDSAGNAQPLATYGPGDFFGEMALFEGSPRSATVHAIEDSECLTMTRGDFMAELKKHPQVAVGMLPALVRRLRDADTRIAQ
jgi:CRP-like cAMP-binding protein